MNGLSQVHSNPRILTSVDCALYETTRVAIEQSEPPQGNEDEDLARVMLTVGSPLDEAAQTIQQLACFKHP